MTPHMKSTVYLFGTFSLLGFVLGGWRGLIEGAIGATCIWLLAIALLGGDDE